jgi:hypothetical protein
MMVGATTIAQTTVVMAYLISNHDKFSKTKIYSYRLINYSEPNLAELCQIYIKNRNKITYKGMNQSFFVL